MPPRQVVRSRCTLAPSAWQKELQRTIAVSCLDEISQGPLLKVDILKKKMAKLYHGDRNVVDSLGYADHLLAGRHQFEYLWEKEEIPSNGADCSNNHPSAYDLVLSTLCSRDESVRYIVGKQFTAQSIKGATQKGHAVISGTTLLGQAQQVLRNWKKALAYGAEFLLPDGSLRSGMDTADYFNHVLKEMYCHLNVTTTITAILDDNGDDDDDDQPPLAMTGLPFAVAGDNEMPESYFFPGFVSFVLFGPFAHDEGHKSILLQTKDCSYEVGERASAGRAAAKRKASDERTTSRASGVTLEGSVDGKRGASSAATKESAERAAKLAMTDDLVSSTIVSNSIMALSQMSQSKRDRIDRMMKQQERHAIDSPLYITIQDKIDQLDEEIALTEDKLCGLATNSKRKREAIVDLGFIAISRNQLQHNGRSGSSSPPEYRSNESSPDDICSPGSSSPLGVYSPPSVEGVFSPVARLPPYNS